MTPEEAKKVFEVARRADGYCSYCHHEIIEGLIEAFPDLREIFEAEWQREYECPFNRVEDWVED